MCAAPAWPQGQPDDATGFQAIDPATLPPIDLNLATLSQLERLPMIGVGKAALILDARRAGPFRDWDDFRKRVPGFRAKALERLQQGGAYIGQPAASESVQ